MCVKDDIKNYKLKCEVGIFLYYVIYSKSECCNLPKEKICVIVDYIRRLSKMCRTEGHVDKIFAQSG